MKRCFFSFVFILITLASYSQKSRIIYLTGKVGKYEAEMTLTISDNRRNAGGFYHYKGKNGWLKLSGESSDGINFSVKEFPCVKNEPAEMATGLFTGTLTKENKFKGQWTAPDRTALEFLFTPGNIKNGLSFVNESYKRDTSWFSAESSVTESASCSIEFLHAVPANFPLDTFIFHRLYYEGIFGDSAVPAFPDYSGIVDKYIRYNEGSDFSPEWSAGSEIIWNGSGVLSIGSGFWEYGGGAHGVGYAEYTCFNLGTGKKLVTDNIFLNGYDEPLRLKAVEHLDGDPDFIKRDSLQLNGNFYITPDGIGFYYNSYEITAYMSGPRESFIPWSEINQWIDPEGPMGWVKGK